MFLYKTKNGWMVRSDSMDKTMRVPAQPALTTRDDLYSYLSMLLDNGVENGDSAPEARRE